jgi:hypothetical protein
VGLTDQIVKRLGSILSGENLVTHLVKSRSFLKNVILSEAKNPATSTTFKVNLCPTNLQSLATETSSRNGLK